MDWNIMGRPGQLDPLAGFQQKGHGVRKKGQYEKGKVDKTCQYLSQTVSKIRLFGSLNSQAQKAIWRPGSARTRSETLHRSPGLRI